jgi:4-alpha-glucanotransferase
MKFPRSSGVLMHPTSFPGRFGIGELGPESYAFIDFLKTAGQKLWQVLPLNPTGYGDSPFQSFSASAGNPLLISLEKLQASQVLEPSDLRDVPYWTEEKVDFGSVIRWKMPLLKKAAERFRKSPPAKDKEEFEEFCRDNAGWLDDFALFMAHKDLDSKLIWNQWEKGMASRNPETLREWRQRLDREIQANKYWQFEFFRQWSALRAYAHSSGIRILGDIPIYVALDSADVWANPEYFLLDAAGRPLKVAGVPPDYFSATGQLWGNPIYNWERHKQTGYRWWVNRFRSAFRLYDAVRIDHFRGFEAYWEIPAGETTAMHGHWVKGPGGELFSVLQRELGELPIVAENLGVITPEVEAIRAQFSLPGMAILQFAFGNDPQGPTFRPHNYARDLVAYTGTHDNDTVVGWWNSKGTGDSTRTPEDVVKEHAFALAYLGFKDEPIHWVLIRGIMSSIANTCVIPSQDVLGLSSEARMNLPGTPSGNWRWRCKKGALTEDLANRLCEMVKLYDR